MRDVATATSTGLGELSFNGLIQAFKTCNSRHAHVEALSPMVAIHGWSMEACCNPSVSSGSEGNVVEVVNSPQPQQPLLSTRVGIFTLVRTNKSLTFMGVGEVAHP